MNMIESLVLGVVQGLTEFLPVSSSGHLAIAKTLFTDIQSKGALFETVLHGGTALAVVYFF